MSTESTRLLRAVDLKTNPAMMARDVIREGSDAEHNWMLYFFKDFVREMAELEHSQGGYRTTVQIELSAYCKWLQGAILDAEALAQELEYKGRH